MEVYSAGEGRFFERLSPFTKLVWIILISITAFLCATNLSLILLYVYVLMLLPLSSGIRRYLRPLLKMSAIVMLAISLSQAFFYRYGVRNIQLFSGVVFSIDGLIYGLLESLIILIMASASTLMAASTPPEDMIDALARIKVPSSIGFMSTLALRFLPVVIEDAKAVTRALSARGIETSGIINKFRSLKTGITTLLVAELRRAEELSTAITLRSYDPKTLSKHDHEIRFRKEDILLFFTLSLALSSVLLMRVALNFPLFLPPWSS